MNERLPKKYNNNIFYKFFHKIRTLFFKKEETVLENVLEVNYDQKKSNDKNDFFDKLKIDNVTINTDYKKKEFIKTLTENPKLLNNFSVDKLEIILQYYLDENQKKKEILKRITA